MGWPHEGRAISEACHIFDKSEKAVIRNYKIVNWLGMSSAFERKVREV